MDVKAYNRRIREKKVELDSKYPSGYLFVTLRNGGQVSEVTCEIAARDLTADTHYVSLPEEIQQYERRNAAVREQLQRVEVARNKPSLGITVRES